MFSYNNVTHDFINDKHSMVGFLAIVRGWLYKTHCVDNLLDPTHSGNTLMYTSTTGQRLCGNQFL